MPRTFQGGGVCAKFNGQRITNTYAYNWFLGSDDSYPFSTYLRSPDRSETYTSPMTHAQIAQPANVCALFHSAGVPPYGFNWGCTYVTIETPDFLNKIRMRVTHKNGDNVAFADGHSKWFELKDVDSAGLRKTIYIWASRGIWMYPGYPERTAGFPVH